MRRAARKKVYVWVALALVSAFVGLKLANGIKHYRANFVDGQYAEDRWAGRIVWALNSNLYVPDYATALVEPRRINLLAITPGKPMSFELLGSFEYADKVALSPAGPHHALLAGTGRFTTDTFCIVDLKTGGVRPVKFGEGYLLAVNLKEKTAVKIEDLKVWNGTVEVGRSEIKASNWKHMFDFSLGHLDDFSVSLGGKYLMVIKNDLERGTEIVNWEGRKWPKRVPSGGCILDERIELLVAPTVEGIIVRKYTETSKWTLIPNTVNCLPLALSPDGKMALVTRFTTRLGLKHPVEQSMLEIRRLDNGEIIGMVGRYGAGGWAALWLPDD